MTATQVRKFDAAMKRRYVNLVAKGKRPMEAAEKLGFAYRTVKKHLIEDVDFREAVLEAEASLDDMAEGKLLEKVMDGNMTALQMWLYNRKPEAWRDMKTVRQEISGAGGGPIQIASMVAVSIREALNDPDSRNRALELVRSIDPAPGVAGALEAHGHAVAPDGVGVGGFLPAPECPEPSEIPEPEGR